MAVANSLHGPSIDDLVWLRGLDTLSRLAQWQLLYQVMQREQQVREAQERLSVDSIAYRITSEKLRALKQLRLTLWSSIYPRLNGYIHLGVYQ